MNLKEARSMKNRISSNIWILIIAIVPFIEKNITNDEAAFKELTEDLGLMSTPIIQVGDETLVGFNQKRLRELLGLN